jgi:hypothetical protein
MPLWGTCEHHAPDFKHWMRRAAKAIQKAADALQASEERELRLRALCEERMENGLDTCALWPSDVVAILDGGKP